MLMALPLTSEVEDGKDWGPLLGLLENWEEE